MVKFVLEEAGRGPVSLSLKYTFFSQELSCRVKLTIYWKMAKSIYSLYLTVFEILGGPQNPIV